MKKNTIETKHLAAAFAASEEARKIMDMLATLEEDDYRRDALECALVELSNVSGVPITDPTIVGIFYLRAVHKLLKDKAVDATGRQALVDIRSVLAGCDASKAQATAESY